MNENPIFNASSTEDRIKKIILRHLMAGGKQMIPQLADTIGYSVPTVTKYVGKLLQEGYISDFGKIQSARGRQPSLYGINPDSAYFVGVDIKRFSLGIALMDLGGEIIDNSEVLDFQFENTPAVMDNMCKLVCDFINRVNVNTANIMAVSVNISGRVDTRSGYSYSVFNFEDNDAPLADILSDKIGKKVYIENDTRAMTYGEFMVGNARPYRNALFVNASWGIGLGIIIDNKLYYGKDGYSGEFGHMNIYANEVMCHCGKKGCLETEISGSAIRRKLMERIKAGESSILSAKIKSGETITTKDIIAAADREDTMCIELIEQMGGELGRQLANMINIFNPEAVIIGGSFARASDYFLPPIQIAIRKYSLKLMSRDIVIIPSRLLGNAGVTGACMIARHRIFD